MTEYKTIAESKKFIILDRYELKCTEPGGQVILYVC
jgi:hypothetical protein